MRDRELETGRQSGREIRDRKREQELVKYIYMRNRGGDRYRAVERSEIEKETKR